MLSAANDTAPPEPWVWIASRPRPANATVAARAMITAYWRNARLSPRELISTA